MSAGRADRTGAELAAVHVLTALHALAHALALTAEDAAEVERWGAGLGPPEWRRTAERLQELDWGVPATGLDPGLHPLVLRWLGLADEGAFVEAFGHGLIEALEGCRGRLAELARAVESGGRSAPGALGCLVTIAWSRRGSFLLSGLPDTARAAVEALERALEHARTPPDFRRTVYRALAVASDACGDVERAERARGRLVASAVEGELGGAKAPELAASALVLSAIFAITDGELLLGPERGADPAIEPGRETWARVRDAVRSGRIAEVPIPVRTLAGWTAAGVGPEEALRASLVASADRLEEIARVVELLWGRPAVDTEGELGVAYWVQAAAHGRWAALRDGYRATGPEPHTMWLEVHQGAARPETMDRARILRRVHKVFCRAVGVQPTSLMEVCLDRADEHEARGEHDLALAEIESALEIGRGASHDPVWWRPAELRLGRWLLASGAVREARELLGRLHGPDAAEVRAAIDDKAAEREALAGALEAWERRADAGTGARLALAHLRAGHSIAAERTAHEVCRRLPGEPAGWQTLAVVLEAAGRYRDARSAMAAALERGFDEAEGRAFVERMSARTRA